MSKRLARVRGPLCVLEAFARRAPTDRSIVQPSSGERAPALTRVFLVLGIICLSVALLVFALAVLRAAGRLIPIVIFSTLLVYLVTPVVQWLQRFLPKHVAVLVTFIGLLALLAGFVSVVFPILASQAQQLTAGLPDVAVRAQAAIDDPQNPLFRNLPAAVRTEISQSPRQLFTVFTRYGIKLAQQGFSAAIGTFSLFLVFIIIPILAIYMLFDYAELERGILGLVPAQERPRAIAIIRDLSGATGAFVRGMVLDGIIVGTMIFIWLTIMHVPFALIIAVAAGTLNLIPYAGAIAGFVPSVLLALAYNGPQNALWVAIGFAVIQQIDGDFVVPRIMSASVKLSPVIVIISIIALGSLFGIFGALVAVPIAAMLRVFKLHYAPSPSFEQIESELPAARRLMKFK